MHMHHDRPPELFAAGSASSLGFAMSLGSRFDLPQAVFVDLVSRAGLRHLRSEHFALADDRSAVEGRIERDALITRRTEYGLWAVLRLDANAVAFVDISRGSATIEVASTDRSALARHCADLGARLGMAQPNENDVAVTFWALGSHGPRSARRRIKAPTWEEIRANYEQQTSLAVADLVASRLPEAGRLVLWYGDPGTGKTNALRALARLWGDWCATHFITDPEAFLGSGTSYLLDVLTTESRSSKSGRQDDWKLVVLEDSGELLTADAHQRTGQALSRLLNVTDGLLGQGMNVVVLVTTNEPLGRLHPAIQREGRCWSQIEFRPLSLGESNDWLAARGAAARVTRGVTIADLFALLRGREPAVPAAFGFGAA